MTLHEATVTLFRRCFKKWVEDFNSQLHIFVRGSKGIQERNAEIINMRNKGATLGMIADRFEMNNNAIRKVLTEFTTQIRRYSKASHGPCRNCQDFKDDNSMSYCDACISAKKLIYPLTAKPHKR